ncbi:ornithine carbamoyltransferase [Legionella cincinnatiensis]|uniref:Ornithine carbamoyltransferase n=1 Tax=Legionella cincinnatiensis TaxID=28085 RepID=A0A378IWH1_9GAMM|nr:ornithine carbamoyltransferase [Legionella cincinnatiensis]KTC85272.1 Ornithine carbamoyltransferase [Legionella cincinnatiensis]STX36364.1 Ornithine carbamoyltransferase [Legionella cincinnatiensis]
MSLTIPVNHTIVEDNHSQTISEVTTNTFVINLQQAIFDLEVGAQHTFTTDPTGVGDASSMKKIKHFLTGTELSTEELKRILEKAKALKQTPSFYCQALASKSLAMIFEKPSFRTRLSFAMAIQSMGGIAIESLGNTRKQETPADMARVLNGYTDFIMMRTHADEILQEMAVHAKVPVINGLSALHHPCQILADLLSLWEHFGSLDGLTVAYVGDGNNILHSLMLLAPQLGITINYCCPESRQPNSAIIEQAHSIKNGMIYSFSKPEMAVKNADAVYTDVWASMGFEALDNSQVFQGFQVNESLMSYAKSEAVFMHCMPMERGKEVSETLPDSPASIIFTQSENRLHVQKALLLFLNL